MRAPIGKVIGDLVEWHQFRPDSPDFFEFVGFPNIDERGTRADDFRGCEYPKGGNRGNHETQILSQSDPKELS